MKKIILILVVFLLTLTGCVEERIEDMSKLELRDQKIYVKGENKPYTGTFIKKYENGNLARVAEFKNGVVHGKEETYDKNGQLALLNTYKEGKKDGPHRGYYENGNLQTEATYKNGNLDGISKVYHKNGQLWSELKHLNGVQINPIKWYDENGRLKYLEYN